MINNLRYYREAKYNKDLNVSTGFNKEISDLTKNKATVVVEQNPSCSELGKMGPR